MRVGHNLSASFDDPDLVSCAGLIPVMALAERAGLHDLAAAHVRVPGSAGSNPAVKVAALVAGMVAGADSIDAVASRLLVNLAGRAPLLAGAIAVGVPAVIRPGPGSREAYLAVDPAIYI